MANQLKSSDVYKDTGDLKEFVKDLRAAIAELTALGKVYKKTITGVRTEAGSVDNAMKTLNGSTSKNRQTIEENAKEADKMAKTYKLLSKTFSENNKKLVALKEGQRKANQIVKLQAKLNRSAAGSYDKLSAQYSLAKIRLNAMSKEQRKNTKEGKEAEKQAKVLFEDMKKLQEATGKHALSVGDYSKALGPLSNGWVKVTTAVKGFLRNPVVLTISLIVGALAALKKSMSRSEEGQDRLNKVMRIAGSVFDNVLDIVADLGIALFDTIPSILKRAGNKIKLFALNAKSDFKIIQLAIADFFGQDEKAEKLRLELDKLGGEIKELKEENEGLTKTIGEGFESLTKKVKNFGDEVRKDISDAKKLADLEASLSRKERKVIVENARLAKESAELIAFAEKVKKVAAEESIEALEKAFDIEKKRAANEVELAKFRFDIRKKTSALAKDDKAALQEVADAEAAIFEAQQRHADVERARERRMNFLKLEAFKQENDRRKNELEIIKLSADLENTANKNIISSTRFTADEKIAAADRVLESQTALAEESFEIQKALLEKEKELSLKSEEDFLSELKTLEARKTAIIEKAALERDKLLEGVRKQRVKALGAAEFLGDFDYSAAAQNETITRLKDHATDTIGKARRELLEEMGKEKPEDIFDLMGIQFKGNEQEQAMKKQALTDAFQFAKDQINELAALRVEKANEAVEMRRRDVESARQALDVELQNRRDGFANLVETKEKELELAKANQKKAEKEQQRALKAQRRIQTIQQAANLVTAAAKILGQLGIAGIPAVAIMFATFAAAKIKAGKLSRKQFGKGGHELLDWGGSHTSGDDIPFGVSKDGKSGLYAQRGERWAVFNKTAEGRYNLPEIINSLNNGGFESSFLSMSADAAGIPIFNVTQNNVNTTVMEGHLKAIRHQGEEYRSPDGTFVKRGNKSITYINP